MRTQSVLPDVDAFNWNRQLNGRQCGANVGRHVVGPLFAMAEQRVSVGHEAAEEAVEIVAHVGIGVLLDQQAGRMGTSVWRGKFNKSSGKVLYEKTAGTGTVEIVTELASVDFGMDALATWVPVPHDDPSASAEARRR
jgi:hypothetical protein